MLCHMSINLNCSESARKYPQLAFSADLFHFHKKITLNIKNMILTPSIKYYLGNYTQLVWIGDFVRHHGLFDFKCF